MLIKAIHFCLFNMFVDLVCLFSPVGVKEIDIAATLEHVRDQRPGMVCTKVSVFMLPLRLGGFELQSLDALVDVHYHYHQTELTNLLAVSHLKSVFTLDQ